MKIEEIKNEDLLKQFEIAIPAQDIQSKYNKEIKDICLKGKFDGFRPGKIPASIVESRHGESVYAEVSNKTIEENIKKLFEEKKIKPASQPKIDVKKNKLGSDVLVNIFVETIPDISIPDFQKISLEYPVIKLAQKDIDESAKEVAAENKTYKEKAGKAVSGNQVIIDFNGKINGNEFQGGNSKKHPLIIGSKTMIPGFEDGIIGYKAGDEFTIKVTFPKDYHSKEFAGKNAEFDIVLHQVNDVVESKLDDALAKKLGSKDVSDLKEKVRKMIEENYNSQIAIIMKMQLFNKLEKLLDFPVPQSMYDAEYKSVQQETQKDTELLKSFKSKKSEEEYYNNITLRRVRIGLMLSEFAIANNVKVEQQDLYNEIIQRAKSNPGYEKAVYDFYQSNPQALDALRSTILENKAVDRILTKEVKRTEKIMNKDDMDKFLKKEQKDSMKYMG